MDEIGSLLNSDDAIADEHQGSKTKQKMRCCFHGVYPILRVVFYLPMTVNGRHRFPLQANVTLRSSDSKLVSKTFLY